MQWELVVALAVAIPVILVPVAFVGYLTLGGFVHARREARHTGAARGMVAGTTY